MSDNLFSYFFLASLLFVVISSVFYFIQKKNIITHYKQSDSVELKDIHGMIITEGGSFRKKIQWCRFDILINKNSIFLFPKNFYIIPGRFINLIFSNSDKRCTRNPTIIREFKLNKNNIELISYPNYFFIGCRKIYLKNLSGEQVVLFKSILEK